MQSVKMGDFEDKKKVYNSGPDELLRQRRADRKEHR